MSISKTSPKLGARVQRAPTSCAVYNGISSTPHEPSDSCALCEQLDSDPAWRQLRNGRTLVELCDFLQRQHLLRPASRSPAAASAAPATPPRKTPYDRPPSVADSAAPASGAKPKMNARDAALPLVAPFAYVAGDYVDCKDGSYNKPGLRLALYNPHGVAAPTVEAAFVSSRDIISLLLLRSEAKNTSSAVFRLPKADRVRVRVETESRKAGETPRMTVPLVAVTALVGLFEYIGVGLSRPRLANTASWIAARAKDVCSKEAERRKPKSKPVMATVLLTPPTPPLESSPPVVAVPVSTPAPAT